MTRKAWQQKREAAGNAAAEGEEMNVDALFTFSFYSVLNIACEMAPNSFQIQLNQPRNSFTAMPRNSSPRQAQIWLRLTVNISHHRALAQNENDK